MRSISLALGLVLLGAADAAAQNVYFGNLHAHTAYSDGTGTPAEAFAAARSAGLDFLAVTEHNHDKADGSKTRKDGVIIATRPELYAGSRRSLLAASDKSNRSAGFVALYGQEVSTISSGNHINVFDVAEVIRAPNGDVPALLAWSSAHPASSGGSAVMQFNHPRGGVGEKKDYGKDDYATERDWVAALDPHVELIEILNAPALKDGTGFRAHHHEREYFGYLNLGFHLAPSVGHDNHYTNWGRSTDARVALVADRLTKVDLLAAMASRHAYASEDKNLRVIFRANGGLMGDIVPPPAPGAELDLQVEISDADEPDATYRIDVFLDEPGDAAARAPVESFQHAGDTTGPLRLDGVRFTQPDAYVLLRITQAGVLEDPDHEDEDDRVWTAPVWFEFGTGPLPPPPPPPPPLQIASLLPNPSGDDVSHEAAVVRNVGMDAIDLTGWRLRDLTQNTWEIGPGVLAAGATLTVVRQGQAMSMNNGGDTIELLDPAGQPVQSLVYGAVSEGQVVEP